MVTKSLVTLAGGDAQCPLCGGRCESTQTGKSILVGCEVCKPFRMTDDTVDRAAELSPGHRMDLRHDVMHAHENGKVLAISLAPLDSKRIFALDWSAGA